MQVSDKKLLLIHMFNLIMNKLIESANNAEELKIICCADEAPLISSSKDNL